MHRFGACEPLGTCTTATGDSPSLRQIDLSLSKEFAFGTTRLSVRADAFNILNVINYGGFERVRRRRPAIRPTM